MDDAKRFRPGLAAWREDDAERRLAESGAAIRDLDLGRARDLARILQSKHYRFEGCATLSEYGRRFGLRPCETWDRAKTGLLLQLQPGLESGLRDGSLTFQAAAALYDVVTLEDEDTDAWAAVAQALPTIDFVAKVEEHLAARKMGGPPVRLMLVVSPRGKRLFEEAKGIVERKQQRSMTDGDTLEVISAAYVQAEQPDKPGGRRRRPPVPRELRSRRIPASVQREVRERDRHRCAVPGCRRRWPLHFAHVVPFRAGGKATRQNIILLCAIHNHMMEAGFLRIQGDADNPRFLNARGGPYRLDAGRREDPSPDPGPPGAG